MAAKLGQGCSTKISMKKSFSWAPIWCILNPLAVKVSELHVLKKLFQVLEHCDVTSGQMTSDTCSFYS